MKQDGNGMPPLEPLRLRRLGPLAILTLIVLPILFIALGTWAYYQQRIHGDVVTNMRSVGDGGAAWGLYLTFNIFFVGWPRRESRS